MLKELALKWDQEGQKKYSAGIEKCALYVMRDAEDTSKTGADAWYKTPAAWNGVTSVSESPQGGEPEAIYADNSKYMTLVGTESLEGSIEAYMYPDEFAACNGEIELESSGTGIGMRIGQQAKKKFGLAYISFEINDAGNRDEILHVIYSCLVSPTEKSFATINDSPEAETMSWDYSSDPVEKTFAGQAYKTSIVTVRKSETGVTSGGTTTYTKWESLLETLFGYVENSTTTPGKFLFPDEIYGILD